MRNFNMKLVGIIAISMFAHATSQAQDLSGKSAAELQRINEIQLLEWYAQEQAAKQAAQQQQFQNVSFNQPRQLEPAVAPEREDLFEAASAGDIQKIRQLLSQGLDVNTYNRERETPLHMAAARGHYNAVVFLVENGAYIHALTVKNWHPIHHAVHFRHPRVANFLIGRGSSSHARTSDGLSAIDMANNNRDYHMLSLIGGR